MKKILLIILLLIPNMVLASNFKLEKLIELDQPWSLTFVEGNKILISEKSGLIFLYDEKNNSHQVISMGSCDENYKIIELYKENEHGTEKPFTPPQKAQALSWINTKHP